MRVIAGSAKGRHLKGPPRKGNRSLARPSSDMVREALFSALDAVGADLSRVLDLYAGTGALGIEALSRGAAWCDFVERDRGMAEVIRKNLRLTGFELRSKVYPVPAERVLKQLNERYTLVLADPPYADVAAVGVLEAVAASPLTAEDTIVVLEHSARDEPAASLGPLCLIRVLRHGDSAISIYCPPGGGPTRVEPC
ncbi:MAG: RsmD family RNA methyltransferase [Chloroflexota bacterium]|nr:RsmD family RNA methyltransferase [Chloroflexota bacterium]